MPLRFLLTNFKMNTSMSDLNEKLENAYNLIFVLKGMIKGHLEYKFPKISRIKSYRLEGLKRSAPTSSIERGLLFLTNLSFVMLASQWNQNLYLVLR